jgi:3-carboxy-cis,cis-muconate cycloisomerase
MTDLLRTRISSTLPMLAVFSDRNAIAHAVAFEAALAAAEAAEGVISSHASEAIARACATAEYDPAELADEAALAGTLAIPLVKRLRAALSGQAASDVHKGATSQDLADTVLMLQTKHAEQLLVADLRRICSGLYGLAEKHAATPSVGRTLLQDALPVGFGLRLAHAAAGIDSATQRLQSEIALNAKIQFGGAAGTRAGLSGKGADIANRMAEKLRLAAGTPWHANRAGVAAIAAALGIVIGMVGKFARDVSLLSQNGVSEAREPAIAGRGGSSAMAHKRNPTGCQVALSAALRAPGLVAGILSGLPAEQERGLGGWQAEAPALADLFLLAAGAADAMATVAEGLEVEQTAIADNLQKAGFGDDIGESAAIIGEILAQRSRG